MSSVYDNTKKMLEAILGSVWSYLIVVGLLVALILCVPAPPEEPVYRLVEVESKTKEWDGQFCFGEGLRTCQNTYKYFINAEKVGSHLWQQVEEGKTYKCDQHDNCEEVKGEE